MNSRGSSSLLALTVVLVLSVVATLGIAARSGDLGFERRSLGRVCARWAAEAGLAEARGMLSVGERPTGFRGSVPPATGHERATYTVRGGVDHSGYRLRAEGACTATDGHIARIAIAVVFVIREGRWAVASWQEGAPAELP